MNPLTLQWFQRFDVAVAWAVQEARIRRSKMWVRKCPHGWWHVGMGDPR